MLERYAEFEIDEKTGEALTIHDRIDLHYNRIAGLQVCMMLWTACVIYIEDRMFSDSLIFLNILMLKWPFVL